MKRKTRFIPKKVKTFKEIAFEYGVTVKTLKRHLLQKDIILQSGSLFPNDCQRIYEALGLPSELKSGDEVTRKE